MFSSTEFFFKNETLNSIITYYGLTTQSKADIFQKVFMLIRLKYFHDSLNIIVILAPGRECA